MYPKNRSTVLDILYPLSFILYFYIFHFIPLTIITIYQKRQLSVTYSLLKKKATGKKLASLSQTTLYSVFSKNSGCLTSQPVNSHHAARSSS